MRKSFIRTLVATMAWASLAGVAMGVVLALLGGDATSARILTNSGIGVLYALLGGVPTRMIFYYLAPRLDRFSPVVRWVLPLTVVFVIALVASVLGGLVLTGLDIVPGDRYFSMLLTSAVIALGIGVVCTVSIGLYETHRSRLAASNLAAEQARRLAVQAQLASLESRIHPHFLFNTINSVMTLIHEDPRGAESMLLRLSTLLRFTLDAERRGLVALDEELAITRDYLAIESTRLGERLRYTFDVARDLGSVKVPPLAVQTVVENSIKYAIASRRKGGEIRVSAIRDPAAPDAVTVAVWDDGPGFTEAAMREGHGLDNLRARLGNLFGARGRLVVEPGASGVTVRMTVPASAPAQATEAA